MTPGNHDGVHLGHQALLAAARALADRHDASVVALSFDPHPAKVLAPERAPALLTTLERRRELLTQLGADRLEVLRFDRAFASLLPEEFVRSVLVESLATRGVVIGEDFRFGRGRAGDTKMLRELGRDHGFEVQTVEPVMVEGDVVSSTRIRRLVADGDVRSATSLLGRVHDVDGRVVRGDGRGRSIGVPTANLDCDPVLLPKDGVYGVVLRVHGEDELVFGVANLGVRPTFAAGRSVEVHLFDFDRDIYDARVRVGFVERLRGERKFDGVEALKAQIAADAHAARALLGREERTPWRLI